MCLHFSSGASAGSPPGLASHWEYRLQVFVSVAFPTSPQPSPPHTGWADYLRSGYHPSSSSLCSPKWAPFLPARTHRRQRAEGTASLWRRPHVTQEVEEGETHLGHTGALWADNTTLLVYHIYCLWNTSMDVNEKIYASLRFCCLPPLSPVMATAAEIMAIQSGAAKWNQEKAIRKQTHEITVNNF